MHRRWLVWWQINQVFQRILMVNWLSPMEVYVMKNKCIIIKWIIKFDHYNLFGDMKYDVLLVFFIFSFNYSIFLLILSSTYRDFNEGRDSIIFWNSPLYYFTKSPILVVDWNLFSFILIVEVVYPLLLLFDLVSSLSKLSERVNN
jgi:hypothetical protein